MYLVAVKWRERTAHKRKNNACLNNNDNGDELNVNVIRIR